MIMLFLLSNFPGIIMLVRSSIRTWIRLDTACNQCTGILTVKDVNRPMPGTRLSSGGMLMASISRLSMRVQFVKNERWVEMGIIANRVPQSVRLYFLLAS